MWDRPDTCPQCGSVEIGLVADEDRSTGYRGEEWICARCGTNCGEWEWEPVVSAPLETLKLAIDREIAAGGLAAGEVADQMMREQSGLVRAFVQHLVREVIRRRQDEDATERLLEASPRLREVDGLLRPIAERLGVRRSFLYSLAPRKLAAVVGLVETMDSLRMEDMESRRDVLAAQIDEWTAEEIAGLEAEADG